MVERKVMWGELDAMGVVFYPRYYEWIDSCGHLFFEFLGLPMMKLQQERSILFGLVESSCRYFKPCRYHQLVRITTGISSLEKKTVSLKHVIRQAADGALMVEGLEKRICLDTSQPEQLRAVNIPSDIYAVMKEAAI
jgi:YbgC/YbaW family acyl-CoA thioester hydrolase